MQRIGVMGLEDGPEAGAGVGMLEVLAARSVSRAGLVIGGDEAGAHREGLADVVMRTPDPASPRAPESLWTMLKKASVDLLLPGSARSGAFLDACHDAWGADGGPLRLVPSLARRKAAEPLALFTALAKASIEVAPYLPIADYGRYWPVEFRLPCLALYADGSMTRVGDAMGVAACARRGAVACVSADLQARVEIAWIGNRVGKVVGMAAVRVLADDERGRPWAAVTCADERLTLLANAVAKVVALPGPVLLQVEHTPSASRIIGLRRAFPHWVEAAAKGGIDLISLAAKVARKQRTTSPASVEPGILFTQTAEDIIVDAHAWESLAARPKD